MSRLLTVGLCLAMAVATGATGTASDVVPQRKWQRIDSPNFTVVGDAAVRDLRQVAERMEQLHALIAALTGDPNLRAPDTTVVVFRDRQAYRPFQPRYQGKPVDVAGYFVPGPMNYVTLLVGRDMDYQSVVYHEYVHLATRSVLGVLPPWISEGMAEFYSTFAVVNGGRAATVGGLLPHHVQRLQQEFLPLASLVQVDRDSPYYNERDKSSVFYAESWALMHFLQMGRDRKYAAKVAPFLDAVSRGVPFDQACASQLGTTPAALEQELRAYLYSLVFRQLTVTLPERIERVARLEATAVPEATAHATLGHLLERLGEPDKAREQLDHALRVDGAEPLALALTAVLAADSGRFADAASLARRGADGTRHTYLSHFLRASALDRGRSDASFDERALESALRDSLALNSRFGEGHASLARLRADAPDGLAEAEQSIGRALSIEPERDDYVLILAYVRVRQGNAQAARRLLGPLIGRGSTAELRSAARELMAATVSAGESAAEIAPAAAAAPAVLPSRTPGTASAALLLDLRPVGDGEARTLGRFTALECTTDGVVVVVVSEGGETTRVRADSIDLVDFVSFRDDTRGRVDCGPQPGAAPALVTFRPDPDNPRRGVAIAVEMVPDGYRPPGG